MGAMSQATPFAESPRRPEKGEDQLAEINRKLDLLTEQVSYLYRRTAAIEELKDELMPVARDAMGALSEELVTLEHEFNSEEVVYLLRKLLRNTPRFIRLLDRLESIDGLVTEIEPLSKEVVRTVVDELEGVEQRGHFRVLKGALRALDQISSRITDDDIEALITNSALLVDTARNVARPEVLSMFARVVEAIGASDDALPERVGIIRLLRAMRDPRVQAGLGVGLNVLSAVGESVQPSLEAKDAAHEALQLGPGREMREE